ncbi:MAG: dicarboxylate/amino acid:cation symporter [Candidatus Melainabacteria bacterium]|nr:dicarboxylate/amino acid:cation symporter [Candidatus Melainabacteria bacterium]
MRFFWLLLVALGLGTKRHWHILFAIVLGVLLGLLFADPQYEILHTFFETIGQVFIRLISMIVIPLVISSLMVGMASLGDGRQLGRMGGKVLLWFLALMVISSLIGGALALFFSPGDGLREDLLDPNSGLSTLIATGNMNAPLETLQQPPSLKTLFFNMIPANPIESLAKMEMVPVILFTILFGVATACVGDAGRPIIHLAEAVFTATMKLTDWIMVLAVPGVFSLTFITVAKAGPHIFYLLAPYALVIVLGLLIQVIVVFPLLLKLVARVNALNLYRAISEAIMVAFGTASSSATLPVTIACCERRAGISNRIASFALPTGASINKTGTTLLEVIAVLFLAQAYGITLTEYEVALVLIFAVFASIGTPGVPSAGLITMAIVINSIGENFTPLFAGIAMLWPIDRVLDMCRTTVNVISSCTVAALVAASEGELNRDMLNSQDEWTDVV